MGRVEEIPNHVCAHPKRRDVLALPLRDRASTRGAFRRPTAEIVGCAAHRVVIACGLAASADRTVLGEVGGLCRDVASRISRKPGAGWLNVASLFAAALYPQPTSLSTKAFPCASGR